jgi:hypothetical protein
MVPRHKRPSPEVITDLYLQKKTDIKNLEKAYLSNEELNCYIAESPEAKKEFQKKLYSLTLNNLLSPEFNKYSETIERFYQDNIAGDVYAKLPEEDKSYLSSLDLIRSWVSGTTIEKDELLENIAYINQFLEKNDLDIQLSNDAINYLADYRSDTVIKSTNFVLLQDKSLPDSDENMNSLDRLVSKVIDSYDLIDSKAPLSKIYSISSVFTNLNSIKLSNLNKSYLNSEGVVEKSKTKQEFDQRLKTYVSQFEKLFGKSLEEVEDSFRSKKFSKPLVVSNKYVIEISSENDSSEQEGFKKELITMVKYFPKEVSVELSALRNGEMIFAERFTPFEYERKSFLETKMVFPVFVEGERSTQISLDDSVYMMSSSIRDDLFNLAEVLRIESSTEELIPVTIDKTVLSNIRNSTSGKRA